MRNGDKYVLLTLCIAEEDGQFAAHCRELGTASCGATLDEARVNILDAVELHLDTLEELGDRARTFRERGIRIRTYKKPKREAPVKITVPVGTWVSKEKVPVPA